MRWPLLSKVMARLVEVIKDASDSSERRPTYHCRLHLDDLPWKLFVRLMHAHHPVRRGLVVQEFIARAVWEDWQAELGHGPRTDILLHDTTMDFSSFGEDHAHDLLHVEVKYFYWDSQNFRQAVRQALRQHGGYVQRLILVSLVMVYPSGRMRPQAFYTLMDEIQLGVVICDMAEVTEQVFKPRPWKEVLRDLLAQLPPDHDLAGLTPEEFAEEYQRYYLRKLHDMYEKAKEDQERIKEDQERIKEDQEHIKEDQERITVDLSKVKEDLSVVMEKQERMEPRPTEIYMLLKGLARKEENTTKKG